VEDKELVVKPVVMGVMEILAVMVAMEIIAAMVNIVMEIIIFHVLIQDIA